MLAATASDRPVLRPSIVAFADVLGTAARSSDPARAQEFLDVLSKALASGDAALRSDEYAFGIRSQSFSDNICVSIPGADVNGLRQVADAVGMQAAAFASHGVFLRGAITLGDHYQREDGARPYGPGLSEAAYVERKIAFYPRIVLTESAAKIALGDGAGRVAPLARDARDDRLFVDFVQYYDQSGLRALAGAINRAVREPGIPESAHRKLEWLVAYYKERTGRSPFAPNRSVKVRATRFPVLTKLTPTT